MTGLALLRSFSWSAPLNRFWRPPLATLVSLLFSFLFSSFCNLCLELIYYSRIFCFLYIFNAAQTCAISLWRISVLGYKSDDFNLFLSVVLYFSSFLILFFQLPIGKSKRWIYVLRNEHHNGPGARLGGAWPGGTCTTDSRYYSAFFPFVFPFIYSFCLNMLIYAHKIFGVILRSLILPTFVSR